MPESRTVRRATRALATTALLAVGVSGCQQEAPVEPAAAPTPAVEVARQDGGIPANMRLGDLCRERFGHVPSASGRVVGLMTDSGSVNDGTFNQFAYEGLQAAARCFGFDTTYVASGSADDYAVHLRSLVEQDVEAVVTVGFPLTETTRQVAAEYPDVAFIGLDQTVEDAGDNYARITFRDDQGGFLAGVAAALASETGTVGVVAGPDDVPPVVALAEGFAAGAAHIDPDIDVHTTYLDSFSDPEAGAAAATEVVREGADVVFAPAGFTGTGAVLAAAQQGAWVVGVDQDQYLTTFEGGAALGADRILTSAVKRVDLAVFLQLADLAQDTFRGEAVTLDAASGGITYAPPHDAAVPEEALDRLEAVRTEMAAGELTAGVASSAP